MTAATAAEAAAAAAAASAATAAPAAAGMVRRPPARQNIIVFPTHGSVLATGQVTGF